MLNLGFTEIIMVSVVAIIVVGPERLPTLLGWMGRQYGRLRNASDELRQAFVVEADRVQADKRAETLRRRRDEARKRIEAARAQAASDNAAPIPRSDVGPTPSATPKPDAQAIPDADDTPPGDAPDTNDGNVQ